MAEEKGVMIFGEVSEGKLAPITFEMLGVGRRLANELGEELSAVILGQGIEEAATEAIAHGADKVYLVDDPLLAKYQVDAYTAVLEKVCKQANPNILLFGVSSLTRDLAPRLAFRLRVGLGSDCVELQIDPETKRLRMIRPVFGGNAMAELVAKKRPQMATVRAKTQPPAERDDSRQGEVIPVAAEIDPSIMRTRVRERVLKETEGVSLQTARVVVSGGRGMKGAENFKFLEELAKILGGAVGASKAAVDEGWVPPEMQIGLTGNVVTPDLYIAVGISGAAQHIAGCGYSKHIVAINKDPDAAIFQKAHFGVVSEWQKVLPLLIEKCKELVAPTVR
ncbi:MAG: electron transfer flavoprotein subunit alpha/FixB family protein [Nitrospinota bacterium]|nr:MAG: electron transfer flavoprotein subunit alpha/FixB family protein [Nitrospinota bacterium]